MTAHQTVVERVPEPRRAPRPDRGRRILWWGVLLAGFALQVAWRLHLSLPLTGPVAHGDEDGYLLGARVLAGGPAASLPAWSIMRPMGYPLLLAPIYWFVREPTQVYVGVHILDAALMAANLPLLYLFARRLFGLGRSMATVLAFVITTLPSLVFFSQFALTDALMPELLMLLLLAVHGMVSGRRSPWAGALAGATAGYAANTHVRGLVMLVVLGGLLLLGVWRRWIPRRTAAVAVAAAIAIYVAGYGINAWLEKQLFPTGAVTVDGRVLARLTTGAGLFRVLGDASGQIWHLCTSTYGLAGIGIAAAAIAVLRREGPRATRIVLATALVVNAGIAVATAAGIPDEGRVNNHVYGRYVALFAGVWSLVAIVALARATWGRAAFLAGGGTVIVLLSLGAVEAYAHDKMRHEGYVNFDAPELSFLSGDFRHLHVLRMTVYAIGFMVVTALAFAGWRAVGPWIRPQWSRQLRAGVALVALLVLNLVAMVSITNGISRAWGNQQYHPGPAKLVANAGVVPGASIAEADDLPWNINQRHQREVYWAALQPFHAAAGAPAGRPTYVIANSGTGTSADWPGRRYGYRVVYSYHEASRVTWVVWQRRD